jgi:hypothetical protein
MTNPIDHRYSTRKKKCDVNIISGFSNGIFFDSGIAQDGRRMGYSIFYIRNTVLVIPWSMKSKSIFKMM